MRRIGSAEVTGPIPVSSFVNCLWRLIQAAVAQSVVRRIGSAEVTGPIPVSSFIEKKRKSLNERVCAFLCYGVTVLRYYDECIVMEVWMRGGIYV